MVPNVERGALASKEKYLISSIWVGKNSREEVGLWSFGDVACGHLLVRFLGDKIEKGEGSKVLKSKNG